MPRGYTFCIGFVNYMFGLSVIGCAHLYGKGPLVFFVGGPTESGELDEAVAESSLLMIFPSKFSLTGEAGVAGTI